MLKRDALVEPLLQKVVLRRIFCGPEWITICYLFIGLVHFYSSSSSSVHRLSVTLAAGPVARLVRSSLATRDQKDGHERSQAAEGGGGDHKAQLELALYAGLLKRTVRTGWMRKGVPHPESVAEHSYRMAVLAMLYAPLENHAMERYQSGDHKPLDVNRCVQMALLHDLAEGIVGDLVVEGEKSGRDDISKEEKAQREAAAMEAMLGTQRPDMVNVWKEYEEQNTAEARFLKDLDKLEMLIQADEYERGAGEKQITDERSNKKLGTVKCRDLTDFYESTRGVFKTGVARGIDELLRQRKAARDVRNDAG